MTWVQVKNKNWSPAAATFKRLADDIDVARLQRGLSWEQLGDFAGVSAAVIEKIRDGKPPRYFAPIAKVLFALDMHLGLEPKRK